MLLDAALESSCSSALRRNHRALHAPTDVGQTFAVDRPLRERQAPSVLPGGSKAPRAAT